MKIISNRLIIINTRSTKNSKTSQPELKKCHLITWMIESQ